ncbi:receptor homology region, transmembrane domain- and RING domain-containing protein 1-like [Lolium rigidum]|uniref:receptor homology region, transmembrane domain- and RING domain-containing protein 1-like n=1 Tax=Lolium rigidum TaxID=89674 RepID=UPI001F5DD527|nr:receptor homology region, transmembrane domain- and RING domain-containing protein 1-like [Lolium rigidum]
MKITRGAAPFLLCLCAVVCLMAQIGTANVVLMGNNLTFSFDDVEANFAPGVKGSGVNGIVYTAEPLNACGALTNKAVKGPPSPFALIIRGGCTFDEKVKNAQDAGFKAAIVYDNENSGVLVSMAGSSSGIQIYAVFISKVSGEVLKKFSGSTDVEVWIIPTFENSAWSILAISFISLLAMSAVLATCFFVRRHRIRRDRPRNQETREFHGMSSQLVKAMPSLIFTKVQEDNCTSSMCAICLEDYSVGENLRVLPCRHKFHAACVDMWLTSWRSFCPVCKRDAGAGISAPPASETTPLFSSAVHLPSPTSSFRSSVGASPPRPISRRPSSQSVSRVYSVSGTPHSPNNTQRPYRNASAMSTSRSGADLSNMSSPLLRPLHLSSTHSLVGNHLSPPVNISYDSGYGSRSRHLSSSYISNSGYRSSSHHSVAGNNLSPPVNIGYVPPYAYHSGYGSPSPHLGSSYISNSGYGSSGQHYLGSSSQHYLGSSSQHYLGSSSQHHLGSSSQHHLGSSSQHYLGSSSQHQSSYLRRCGESGPSLSTMAPQSPQSQLNHLAGASSGQSLRQSYLRHCGDSDASLSAMASSGQSLPGC